MTGSQHPGGERLTRRAARLAGLSPGMTLLDIGCGDGTSMRLLAHEFGVNASGIDLGGAGNTCGDARMALLGDELDAVVMECSLSVIGDASLVLSRVYAALAPGGRLILSDVYAKKSGAELWTKEALAGLIINAGFELLHDEDHTPALVTYAAERIGSGAAGHGYVLFIARKPG